MQPYVETAPSYQSRPAMLVPSTGPAKPLFLFVVANQSYALPFGEILQVIHLPALTTPPRMPKLLAGFMNVGGNPIPVVRLDRLFGLPEMTPGIYTPLSCSCDIQRDKWL